jgi:hypothetical protein
MDLAAAVRDGITFFTHKATEGTKTRHVRYGEALNRARTAGMAFMGAYMIPRTPGNNGHGSVPAQVNYFLSYLDAQTPWWRTQQEFFIQVDTEHWGYDDVAPQYGAQVCALLRGQTGKWVVHYAPRWAYGDTIPGDDPLWASSYGANPAVPYRQAYPGDNSSGWAPYSGRTPTILQYGSSLRIGSQPTCDGNAFRGTIDQFRTLVVGDPMAVFSDDEKRKATNADPYLWAYANELDPIPNVIGGNFTAITPGVPNKPLQRAQRIEKAVTETLPGLIAAIKPSGAPTQDQVNVAVLNAMLDSRVQKGIGDAIASHLHVS